MGNRPIFTLDPRLQACSEFVRDNCKIVDVGTDHAYLPIWLAKKNKISHALAVDINEAPLTIADKNIAKYHVENKVLSRLSNGINNVSPTEVDDIIISGMGGETIIQILQDTHWIRNTEKHLILQPMTADHLLREFLFKNNFKIIKEVVVKVNRHVYTVMLAKFTTEPVVWNNIDIYTGTLSECISKYTEEYFHRIVRHLTNQKLASNSPPSLDDVISTLNSLTNQN